MIAFLLSLTLATQGTGAWDEIWYPTKVDSTTIGTGSSIAFQTLNELTCSLDITHDPKGNLFCFEGTTCTVSDVMVAPRQDGPGTACWTKYGRLILKGVCVVVQIRSIGKDASLLQRCLISACVYDEQGYDQGEIFFPDCFPKKCLNHNILNITGISRLTHEGPY